jgi:hypothetical protein
VRRLITQPVDQLAAAGRPLASRVG